MATLASAIDLNLLRTFVTVIEVGGVGAAGRRLGRSQPAISSRLRQLERELGVRLFARSGRRVVPTSEGRMLFDEASALIAGTHALMDRVRIASNEPVGLLRVAALPTLTSFMLAAPLSRLLDRAPRIELQITATSGLEHVEQLAAGRQDLVVGIGDPPRGRRFAVTVVGQVRPTLVAAAKAIQRRRLAVRDLSKLTLLSYGRTGDVFFDRVLQFLVHNDLDQRIRVTVTHIPSLKQLALNGAGAVILPDYTVVEPGLSRHEIVGLSFAMPVWAATRHDAVGVPAIAAALAEISTAIHPRGR